MNKSKGFKRAPEISFILIVGAFFLFTTSSRAQFHFDENCRRTYQAIFSMQFTEACRLIGDEKKTDAANLVPVYLENSIDFLTLFIGEDPKDYDRLKGNKGARISLIENARKESPFYLFCLAEIHLQWAVARVKFGDYTTAAFEIRKAYSLLSENKTRYPLFLINNIGLGVVHSIVGIIPDNYKWMTTLMGMDGSLDDGIEEIRQVADYTGTDRLVDLFKPEALFYLAFFSANLQKNKKDALNLLQRLHNQADENKILKSPLLVFANASIMMKNGDNDGAIKALQERNSITGAYPFYYLDYLEGLARLNRLDYSASGFFDRFINNFRGQNYIRAAYQKQAWISFLEGDTGKYYQTIRVIGNKGVSKTDEDKQAFNEAVQVNLPNSILLKARFLFDGGYYDRALNELLDNSVKTTIKSKRDLIRYNYRLGRIYHETGNYPRALYYYNQSIHRGKKEPWYFAAGAAYQMGLLYENQGAYLRADSAYHVCLSINTPEYKTSLGQKARAGLNRIRKLVPKT